MPGLFTQAFHRFDPPWIRAPSSVFPRGTYGTLTDSCSRPSQENALLLGSLMKTHCFIKTLLPHSVGVRPMGEKKNFKFNNTKSNPPRYNNHFSTHPKHLTRFSISVLVLDSNCPIHKQDFTAQFPCSEAASTICFAPVCNFR